MKLLATGAETEIEDLSDRLNDSGIRTKVESVSAIYAKVPDPDLNKEFKLHVLIDAQYKDALKVMKHPGYRPKVKVNDSQMEEMEKMAENHLFHLTMKALAIVIVVVGVIIGALYNA